MLEKKNKYQDSYETLEKIQAAVAGWRKVALEANAEILKLLEPHQHSELNPKGLYYFNAQDVNDALGRWEDEVAHIADGTLARWRHNLNAGKDAPDLMDQCLTLGRPLPKSAAQVSSSATLIK